MVNNKNTDNLLFVHTADIHLSPRSSTVVKQDNKTNRQIRDLDMERAFIASIDDTLNKTPLPSAYVIAGDVFDTYRGSSDAFITVINQFRRLRNAGIEIVAIAGNHDTPTNLFKTPMFKMVANVFSNDSGVHLAYDEIIHAKIGDIEYVMLPHIVCLKGNFTEKDLEATTDAKCSVLIVHGVAEGDPSFMQMDEMREIPIAKWILNMDWNYVAFGHYHSPGWIAGYKNKAAYSGSLENTVISGPDVCMKRGPVYVSFSPEDFALSREIITLPIRSIIELAEIDITDKDITANELDKQIIELIESSKIDGAIARHKIKGITQSLYKTLPRRNFQSINPNALFIKTEYEFAIEKKEINFGVDENGYPITSETENDIEMPMSFLPLNKEIDNAIELLINKGKITKGKKEDIINLITEYLT